MNAELQAMWNEYDRAQRAYKAHKCPETEARLGDVEEQIESLQMRDEYEAANAIDGCRV
jgi:hypothetical protein